MEKKNKLVHWFIISTFVSLYLIVSIISTIHVIQFFQLSNPSWLAISLALAFEVGAAASLSSIIVMEKMNKFLVWTLFILLTAMQAMGNTYYAYTHLNDFQGWVELFGLVDEDLLYQKRILSIISGAILPLVSLGFIKSLVDYVKPSNETINDIAEKQDETSDIQKIDLGTSETEDVKISDDNQQTQEEILEVNSNSSELSQEEDDSTINDESTEKEEIKEETNEGPIDDTILEIGYKVGPPDNEIQPANSNRPDYITDDPVLRHRMKLKRDTP